MIVTSTVLACALLAGHGMADGTARSWLHIVSFVAIIAVVVYVIRVVPQ